MEEQERRIKELEQKVEDFRIALIREKRLSREFLESGANFQNLYLDMKKQRDFFSGQVSHYQKI